MSLSADVGFKVVDSISIGLRPGSATAAAAATPRLFKGSTEYLWGAGASKVARGGISAC